MESRRRGSRSGDCGGKSVNALNAPILGFFPAISEFDTAKFRQLFQSYHQYIKGVLLPYYKSI
jgi:hypothetical protein